MSNKMYDVLKWSAMGFLPAVATLYFALAGIWGLPYGEEIVGTITAVNTFLGVVLGISSAKYNKKKIFVNWRDPNGALAADGGLWGLEKRRFL